MEASYEFQEKLIEMNVTRTIISHFLNIHLSSLSAFGYPTHPWAKSIFVIYVGDLYTHRVLGVSQTFSWSFMFMLCLRASVFACQWPTSIVFHS